MNVISMVKGGTFKSGFASGFSSSFFSPGTSLGGDGAGGFTLRTTIAGVVGGTASEIGGGKFSNGAVSGAFVHMFNAELGGSVAMNRKRQALLAGAKDGHLTLEEATAWYQNMHGKTLIVDGSRIPFTVNGINEKGSFVATPDKWSDWLVHGTMGISYETYHIYDGQYDFDMQLSRPFRSLATIGGKLYAGNGTPFEIEYRYNGEWKNQ